MVLVTRIEPSCPLGIEESRRFAGVHGKDENARRTPRTRADGPACRAIRRPARLAQVAAIALTLLAGSAFAGDHADAAPAPQTPAAAQDAAAPASPAGKEGRVKQLGTLIVLGAVSDPRDADWVDDSALPELPVIGMDADAQGDANTQPGDAALASVSD
jgi:hypothetical protein